MLHGIKKQFGFYSIFIMIIPYVMIHFNKPFPEIIGAIFAGLILGVLSLQKSIYLAGSCVTLFSSYYNGHVCTLAERIF